MDTFEKKSPRNHIKTIRKTKTPTTLTNTITHKKIIKNKKNQHKHPKKKK